jgi:glutathione S-transferase
MNMLTIHHLGKSQSDRIIWLCEELEIPYELTRYERDPARMHAAPAAYKALHPTGTAPVITENGLTLAESGAIIDYIIHKHGRGRLVVTPNSPDYPDYLFWFHYGNASMMPAEMFRGIMNHFNISADSDFARSLLSRSETAYGLVEDRLGKADYFAGANLSAADIMMLFPLTTMRAFAPRDLTPYPNVRAYLQRVGERPAYRRAMEKADPGFTPLLS